jgi:hypothetical protein
MTLISIGIDLLTTGAVVTGTAPPPPRPPPPGGVLAAWFSAAHPEARIDAITKAAATEMYRIKPMRGPGNPDMNTLWILCLVAG